MPWRIDTRAVIDPYQPRNGVNLPPAGMRYVAIELEVRNESESTQLIEPAVELRLATLAGATFEPAELLEEPGDISFGGPNLGELGPRQSLEGIIVFEVPIGDAPRSLMFYWADRVLETAIEAPAVPSLTSQ
jgi:hypothetical protein